MVRFTSGVTVPFAVSTVGRARVSALAVLNNCGFSTKNTSGSTVTGALLAAAGVSFEQPSATIKTARTANVTSREATPFISPGRKSGEKHIGERVPSGTAPSGLAPLAQPNSFIAPPHGPQTDSTAPQPSNTIPPDSRNSAEPPGNRSPYSENPKATPHHAGRKRKSCPAPLPPAPDISPYKVAAESCCCSTLRKPNPRR